MAKKVFGTTESEDPCADKTLAEDKTKFNRGSDPINALKGNSIADRFLVSSFEEETGGGIQQISASLLNEIRSELASRRLIIARVRKSREDKYSHWVIFKGAFTEGGKHQLVIDDSFDGIAVVDCAEFPGNYKPIPTDFDSEAQQISDISHFHKVRLKLEEKSRFTDLE